MIVRLVTEGPTEGGGGEPSRLGGLDIEKLVESAITEISLNPANLERPFAEPVAAPLRCDGSGQGEGHH